MNKEEINFKIGQLRSEMMLRTQEAILVTLFGTLLIFGLGFVFPLIDPYVVIKWIVIVCAIYFVAAILGNFVKTMKLYWLENGMVKEDKPKTSSRSKRKK